MNDAEPAVLEIRSTNGRYAALALTLSASPGPRDSPSPNELQAARETKAASAHLGSSGSARR